MSTAEDPNETECPVCLEDMEDSAVRELPCAHRICRPCLLQVWDVQQHSLSAWKSGVLTCPMCRAQHKMPDGIHALSTSAPHASHIMAVRREESARTRAEHATQGSIATLSTQELLKVCDVYGVQRDGVMERRVLEEDVFRRLDVPRGGDVVASLNIACLKLILTMRAIPFQDCTEKQDLVERVLQTPRGSCFKLPVAVLKAMLNDYGYQGEVYVDKDNLARRIMAARAMRAEPSASDKERSAGACGEARSGINVSVDARAKRDGAGYGSSRTGAVAKTGREGVGGRPVSPPASCACVAQ